MAPLRAEISRRSSASSWALASTISMFRTKSSRSMGHCCTRCSSPAEHGLRLEQAASSCEPRRQKRAELVDAARTAELGGELGCGRRGAVLQQHACEPHTEQPEAIEEMRAVLDGEVDGTWSRCESIARQQQILGVVLPGGREPSEQREVAFGEERRAEAEKSRDGHRRLAQPADLRIGRVAICDPARTAHRVDARLSPISSARETTPIVFTGLGRPASSSWKASRNRTSCACMCRVR